jgi:hypothetical protein
VFSPRSLVLPGYTKVIGFHMDGEIGTKTVGAEAGPAGGKPKNRARTTVHGLFSLALAPHLQQIQL